MSLSISSQLTTALTCSIECKSYRQNSYFLYIVPPGLQHCGRAALFVANRYALLGLCICLRFSSLSQRPAGDQLVVDGSWPPSQRLVTDCRPAAPLRWTTVGRSSRRRKDRWTVWNAPVEGNERAILSIVIDGAATMTVSRCREDAATTTTTTTKTTFASRRNADATDRRQRCRPSSL